MLLARYMKSIQTLYCSLERYVVSGKCVFTLAASLYLIALTSLSHAETKVVGYIPSWKGFKATVDATDLTKITHINISFLNPNLDGVFANGDEPVCMESGVGADISYLVTKAHNAGVKVLVSVAGGVIPSCSGSWIFLLQPAKRQVVIDNLIAFVDKYNLDGVDVDLEGELLTNIDNAGNYTPFVKALSDALKPKSKLLTCATASYIGGMVPISSITYFDFVNIMSYDNIGPSWGNAGEEQSTFALAQSNITTWKNRGLTKDKLVLGVPFYGYGFGTYKSDYDFKEIVNLSINNVDNDVVGNACAGCSYITYNGIPTIRKKTRLALQEGSGIMIWQLAQDATGGSSLLSAIHNEIALAVGSSSSSSMSSISSSSAPASSSGSVISSASATSSTNSGKSGGGGGGAINAMVLMMLSVFILLNIRQARSKNYSKNTSIK